MLLLEWRFQNSELQMKQCFEMRSSSDQTIAVISCSESSSEFYNTDNTGFY